MRLTLFTGDPKNLDILISKMSPEEAREGESARLNIDDKENSSRFLPPSQPHNYVLATTTNEKKKLERICWTFSLIKSTFITFLDLVLVGCVHCANILVMVPFSPMSHHILFKEIVMELCERGHQVTIVSPVKYKENVTNLEEIILRDYWADTRALVFDPMPKTDDFSLMNLWNGLAAVHSYRFHKALLSVGEKVLRDPAVVEVIQSKERHFDAVFTESFFWQEWLAVFAHRFRAIRIVLSTFGGNSWVNEMSGLPNNPSYQVDEKYFKPEPPATFIERLANTWSSLILVATSYYFVQIHAQRMIDEVAIYPGWETRPKLINMVADNALVLRNTHPSLHGSPSPRAPHVKDVGGLNIDFDMDARKDKELLENPKLSKVRKFMDESSRGFLYFSMGSVVTESNLPPKLFNRLYSAFSKTNINIIMRWKGEQPEKILPNILLTGEFLPQLEILNHKNIRAFGTHGGLLSLTEAIYFAVPVVCFPVFADQPNNALRAVHRGYGTYVNIKGSPEESDIIAAVTNVFNNQSYKEAIQKVSQSFRDRSVSPKDEAVYWIEYVLRHGNVLQPASIHMPFYQVYLLDVVAFMIVALGLTLLAIKIIIRMILLGRKAEKSIQMKNLDKLKKN